MTRVMGLETEYGIRCFTADGTALPDRETARQFFGAARPRLTWLRGGNGMDLFLANGARLYSDQGHPEYATPECDDPREVLRYALAGDRIVRDLAGALVRGSTFIDDASLFKCNVDYSGTGSAWGCHESYQHRIDPNEMPGVLIPHLASRIVCTGAGGFDSLRPRLTFMISPRVAHLFCTVSENSTAQRGIFHDKDESLAADGSARLHVICGESNASPLATLLKVGATALVVRLAEAGWRPDGDMRPADPVAAMRRFALDPDCRAAVATVDGPARTAVEIQRRYLEAVEARLADPDAPAWGPEICRLWRATLDDLATDPSRLDTRLDWRTKHVLFRRHLERRGYDDVAISWWNDALDRLGERLRREDGDIGPMIMSQIAAGRSLEASMNLTVEACIRKLELSRDGLERFLALRRELCELDLRYMHLHPRGGHDSLAERGLVDAMTELVGNVDAALTEPPDRGRASLRGTAIRALAGKSGRHRANWHVVHDLMHKRKLDLPDPLMERAGWTQYEPPPEVRARREPSFIDLLEMRGF